MTLASIRHLVADDAHACTFQTFGQYRTALLKAIDQASPNNSAAEAVAQLATIYDAFRIGSAARSIHILRENLCNVLRREQCLAAIERTFFMVPTEPEEEDDGEPGEECLLNWGQDPDEYVRTFREALKTLSATPAEAVYLVATGETHEGQETYTRHDVRPPLCDAETLYAAAGAAIAARERRITEDEAGTALIRAMDDLGLNKSLRADIVAAYVRHIAALASREEAPVASGEPMFFASAEQANALEDRPGDNEGGRYLPVRKTAAGKFTMPLYASPSGAGLGGAVASSEADAFEAWADEYFKTWAHPPCKLGPIQKACLSAYQLGAASRGEVVASSEAVDLIARGMTWDDTVAHMKEACAQAGVTWTDERQPLSIAINVMQRLANAAHKTGFKLGLERAALASQPGCAVEGEAE